MMDHWHEKNWEAVEATRNQWMDQIASTVTPQDRAVFQRWLTTRAQPAIDGVVTLLEEIAQIFEMAAINIITGAINVVTRAVTTFVEAAA